MIQLKAIDMVKSLGIDHKVSKLGKVGGTILYIANYYYPGPKHLSDMRCLIYF